MAVYEKDNPILFRKALESVFKNTLLPKICLVIADGPLTDDLNQVIQYFECAYSEKMQCLRLEKNLGLAHALNIGLEKIHTNWVVRADSDDQNVPERFSALAKAINENPHIQLIGSFILEVDNFGSPIAVREVPLTQHMIRAFAKVRNPFNHMSVAYRLDPVLKAGGYPPVFLKEDYALWVKLLKYKIPMMNISQVLVRATAGYEMYQRRGGWIYAKSEWQMQAILVQAGIKSRSRAIMDGIIRATFFLIPPRVRGFLYLQFLRKATSQI